MSQLRFSTFCSNDVYVARRTRVVGMMIDDIMIKRFVVKPNQREVFDSLVIGTRNVEREKLPTRLRVKS